MLEKSHPLIAREGWPWLGFGLLLWGVIFWFAGPITALPLLILLLAGGFMFRDPPRRVPALPLAIVAPVDGRLLAVATGTDEFLKREALILKLEKTAMAVFSIRSPIEGKILQQWYQADTRLHANWVQTDEGDDIVWAVSEAGWRKSPHYVQTGERVGQGQRCGFQWFASEVYIYLPLAARTELTPGQKLIAGESVVASLVHNTAPANIAVERTHKQEA